MVQYRPPHQVWLVAVAVPRNSRGDPPPQPLPIQTLPLIRDWLCRPSTSMRSSNRSPGPLAAHCNGPPTRRRAGARASNRPLTLGPPAAATPLALPDAVELAAVVVVAALDEAAAGAVADAAPSGVSAPPSSAGVVGVACGAGCPSGLEMSPLDGVDVCTWVDMMVPRRVEARGPGGCER